MAVIHLRKIGIFNIESFPASLKNLLKIELFLFGRRQVSIDCSRIDKLGVHLTNYFELRNAALHNDPDMSGTTLEQLASKYLGLALNKTCYKEDFSVYPLPFNL